MSVGDLFKAGGILLAILVCCSVVAIGVTEVARYLDDRTAVSAEDRIKLLEDDVALLQEAVDCLLNNQDWYEQIACLEEG